MSYATGESCDDQATIRGSTMKKRHFTRVLFRAEAVVKYKDEVLRGEVENLSLNGMLFKTDQQIPMNAPLEIKISLSGTSSEVSISLNGIIVRQTDEGLGVEFKQMDLDSFIHLRNILAYNTGDETEVMKEFYGHMSRKKP